MIHVCGGSDPPPANKPGLIAKTVDSHSAVRLEGDDEKEKKRLLCEGWGTRGW